MADRWPAAMRRATAAEFLDLSPDSFDRIKNQIPSIQHTERGDRYWMREDLECYLQERRKVAVTPRNQ